MNRRLIATAGVAMLTMVLGVTARAQNQDKLSDSRKESDFYRERFRTIVYDVATDARTFRLNKSGTLLDARRGDGFIVQGKIYPAGTIPPGGTMEKPGPFDPETAAGSIGNWACRGTFNFDIGEIVGGAHPHLYSTQLHVFDNGQSLVSEGPEGGSPQLRAVTGGLGGLLGATGEVLEEPIGVNSTGLFNIRFTFTVESDSRRHENCTEASGPGRFKTQEEDGKFK